MDNVENPLLTVAIPTYNRNAILKENLGILLPQLTNRVEVIIFDNCSELPVSTTLHDELNEWPNLKVYRNVVNIGLSGNIIKCIEHCKTQWVWTLSDDDRLLPNALEKVLEYIDKYPNAININFKSNYTKNRNFDVVIGTQDDFIEKMENINNFFLISLNIYKVNEIRRYLRFSYIFSYSILPHFVIYLLALTGQSKSVFACKELLASENSYEELDQRWSSIPLCMGLPTLFELPLNMSNVNRNKLMKAIVPIIGRPISSMIRIADLYKEGQSLSVWEYNYEQPYKRLSKNLPFFWKIELRICRILFMFPSLIPKFSVFIKKIKKQLNKKTTAPVSDRYNRI